MPLVGFGYEPEPVPDVVPKMELFSACRSRLPGVAVVCGALLLPNSPFTSCSCCAARLRRTTSPGAAFCNADCTWGEDRVEETDADPVLDSAWIKSVIPEFAAAIELIDLHIGRLFFLIGFYSAIGKQRHRTSARGP